jgi:hypothetical protein
MNSRMMIAMMLPLALLVDGCETCDDKVTARAFVGHLTINQCQEYLNRPEAPVSIICPGEEVTVCWRAEGPKSVQIDVSPDAGGQSGGYGAYGALYLTPKSDTTVKITAGCSSTTKQIMAVDSKKQATFDASFDSTCHAITYQIDPLFVSPKVETIDVTANFSPYVAVGYADGSSGTVQCKTPPFLSGWHPQEYFGFKIDDPYVTTPFVSSRHLVGDWDYAVKVECTQSDQFECNRAGRFPFAMTLTCP